MTDLLRCLIIAGGFLLIFGLTHVVIDRPPR
jgi:hypothetical protein